MQFAMRYRYPRFIYHGVSIVLVSCGLAPAVAQQSETVDDDQAQFERVGREAAVDHPVVASDDSEKLRTAAEEIVQRTNAFRNENDREPLQTDPRLVEAAVEFAKYMARTGRYGHQADGQRASQRIAEESYDYCLVAENIAYAYRSTGYEAQPLAEQFVQGWIESKGHRENMLLEPATETGVGVAQDEKTGYYFSVQLFGRPRSAAIEFTVTNESSEEAAYKLTYRDGTRTFSLPPRATMTHTRCRPPEIWLAGSSEDQQRMKVDANDQFIVRTEKDQPVLIRGK